MYVTIDPVNQKIMGLHRNAEDMCQYLEQVPLPKYFIIVRVETLEELYDQLYQ